MQLNKQIEHISAFFAKIFKFYGSFRQQQVLPNVIARKQLGAGHNVTKILKKRQRV